MSNYESYVALVHCKAKKQTPDLYNFKFKEKQILCSYVFSFHL